MRIFPLLLTLALPHACLAQEIVVRRVVRPAPINLAELQSLPGPTPHGPCSLAPVNLDSTSLGPVLLGDSTTLLMPRNWERLPAQELDLVLEAMRLALPDGGRVRISRQRNGASGRGFTIYRSGETPEGRACTFVAGDVGAIWTFYAPDPDARDQSHPFFALADLITPERKWYRVSSSSRTSEERDFTARVITALFFRN